MADRAGATSERAVRVTVRGRVQGVFMRASTVEQAERIGALGWVRNTDGGEVQAHIEGSAQVVEEMLGFLRDSPGASNVEAVDVEDVKPEGHEQFAVRGVSAGRFVVVRGHNPGSESPSGGGYELRLEVDGGIRSWRLPKDPSMDPAVKRTAFEVVGDAGADLPGDEVGASEGGDESAGPTWDSGTYEQGGRVAWPDAIERGHAVFVLHGSKLRGGFALQRIRSKPKPQWLLIKRRDEFAESARD